MAFKPWQEWHDDNCEWREEPRVSMHGRGAVRSAYCLIHGQWATEFSVKSVAYFADGEKYEMEGRMPIRLFNNFNEIAEIYRNG